MISQLKSDKAPTTDVILQNESGFLDNVWAYFLHDYDNIEDDKFSVESNQESVLDDEYKSSKNKVLDSKTRNTTERNTSQDELKKSALSASLNRSTELLAHLKKLDAKKKSSADRRYKLIDKGVATNEKRVVLAPEDREYNVRGNADTYSERDEPPKVIYFENDCQGGRGIGDTRSRKARNVSTTTLRKNFDQKSSVHIERGARARGLNVGVESNRTTLDEIKAMKRRDLIRRISLLRIKATKARIARVDV